MDLWKLRVSGPITPKRTMPEHQSPITDRDYDEEGENESGDWQNLSFRRRRLPKMEARSLAARAEEFRVDRGRVHAPGRGFLFRRWWLLVVNQRGASRTHVRMRGTKAHPLPHRLATANTHSGLHGKNLLQDHRLCKWRLIQRIPGFPPRSSANPASSSARGRLPTSRLASLRPRSRS